jgi:aminoglycoside phosphotransferase (APT) family kinase protein
VSDLPIDRATVNAALARRLVDDQFPQWADLPIEPVEVDGWDNRTFRLGSDRTVRLPNGPWYAQQVAKEQRWLPVLAPLLPLPIPLPEAHGRPGAGYPYPWSVYRWIEGELASRAPIGDLPAFASALAGFLTALRGADASAGPEPGEHNFFRGAHPSVYGDETADAIDALGEEIPADAARRAWEDATSTRWDRDPVWFHGDVAVNNLLVRDGALAAVIDFGTSGVGDPACDVVIAWTFFSGRSRARFRAELDLDAATWSRGRGWGLWKALITLVADLEAGDDAAAASRRREIGELLADDDGSAS